MAQSQFTNDEMERRDVSSPKDVRPATSQFGREVTLAILLLVGASVMSARDVPADVVFLYRSLWGTSILLALWLRWRTQVPLRAPAYRIVVTTIVLLAALWIIGALRPLSTERGVDITSVSSVWRFASAALVVPAAIGRELFFRGLIYNLARRKGTGAAIAASGLLPAALILPFSGSLMTVLLGTVSGLLLAASRAVTGSLAPALLAQILLSLPGAAFILLVA